MSLEELLERIERDAEEEAGRIESAAETRAEQIRDRAREEADAGYREKVDNGRESAESEKRRNIAIAHLEVRNDILSLKREMIQKAFDKALERLRNLPKEDYIDLLRDMLLDAVEEGDELVILSPDDRDRIGGELIEGANGALRERGQRADLKLADETRLIQGGFILRRGGVETNLSLGSVLEAKREKVESEVVSSLWR